MGDFVQAPPPAEPNGEDQPVYRPAQTGDRLWQGEILENVIQIRPTIESLQPQIQDQLEVVPVVHDLVIVMTQDCDLEQDHKRRAAGEQPSLPNVLLCDVYLAEVLRVRLQAQDQLGRKDWNKRIGQNQIDRFHYLEKVNPELDLGQRGLTALALDFRLYFTLPTDELYTRLMTGAHRRCRLNSPYLEHLAHRFFKFQSRVALPRDHAIDPIPE